MTTLTVKEVMELASFVGIQVDRTAMEEDDLEYEVTLEPCPKRGVSNDDGVSIKYSGHVAYFTDMPEEGCYPLGDRIN